LPNEQHQSGPFHGKEEIVGSNPVEGSSVYACPIRAGATFYVYNDYKVMVFVALLLSK
jgi:hypothetical protein